MKSKFKHCIYLYFYLFNDLKHLNLTNMFKKKKRRRERANTSQHFSVLSKLLTGSVIPAQCSMCVSMLDCTLGGFWIRYSNLHVHIYLPSLHELCSQLQGEKCNLQCHEPQPKRTIYLILKWVISRFPVLFQAFLNKKKSLQPLSLPLHSNKH